MKLFGIAALGLVAARPQPQLEGLSGGLTGLDADLDNPPVLDNENQVKPQEPNKMPAKKPVHADKVGDGMKDKHVDNWNEKNKVIYDKYSKAHDKAKAKEDRVEANNEEFAKDKVEKKNHALQKKEEFKADTSEKKFNAQMKLTQFHTDKVDKQTKHKLHKEKLDAKSEEKKKDNQEKMDDALEKKEDVEEKTELKKQNAAAAQAKKEATEQLKKDKADHVKWAHYHKILFNCVKKVKDTQKDAFDLNALNMESFEEFDGCQDALKDFNWADNFDGFKEKWNHMKEKMEDKMEAMD